MKPEDMERVTFFDRPIHYPIERYQQVRDAYIEAVAELPGVLSIYQMGSTSAPGISDLDLIVVMESSSAAPPARAFSTRWLDGVGRYIFMHPGAMVTSEAVFKRLPVLIYAASLTHLHGRRIVIDSAETDGAHVAMANLIDQSTHLMHQLTKCVVSRVVYVRRLIMALSSIAHTLSLLRLARINVDETWDSFVQDMQRFKKDWFENSDKHALMVLLGRGADVVMRILFAVEQHMADRGIIHNPASVDDVVFYQSPNAFTLFTHKAKAIHVEGCYLGRRGLAIKYKQRYLNTTLSVVAAPRAFAQQVIAYTRGNSVLSSRLRGMIAGPTGDMSIAPAYETLLRRRVALWSENLDYLARCGLLRFDVMPFPGARRAFTDKKGLAAVVLKMFDSTLLTYNQLVFRRSVASVVQCVGAAS